MPLYRNRFPQATDAMIVYQARCLADCTLASTAQSILQWAKDHGALGLLAAARVKIILLSDKERENG